MTHRIGYGEDAHRLEAGRPLWIGGLEILDSPHGAVAHSDGDALLHCLSDALLSSVSSGDIGMHFSDTDPQWKGVSSEHILKHCLNRVLEQGYTPINVAVVVTLDRPKLGPLRDTLVSRVAELLKMRVQDVGLTFKTSEGLAPAHIQARATLLLESV